MAGCGKQEAAPGQAGGADTGILPSELGSKVGEVAGQAKDTVVSTLKSQLAQQQSQVESLTESAKSLGDEKLDQVVSTLKEKLNAAQGKLNEVTNAEGSTTGLQNEFKTIMGDVQSLYQQAMQRMAELKGAAGGVKLPGG